MDITLALGGGGSRGVAHVGVLRVLEREGFNIRAVAGTSMGGVDARDEDLFRARPLGPGILGIKAIEEWLRSTLGSITFEDLPIPFAVTAVDLESGMEMVLKTGGVVDAVLATIALPGIFPPRSRDDHRLVDGGIVDPVPVRPAKALSDLPCIAVVLSPSKEDWASDSAPNLLDQLPWIGVVSRLRPAQALNIFVRSLEISSRYFTELRLESDKPDVIIRPDVAHIGLLDEPSVSEVVALGEKAAERALPDCRAQFTIAKRIGRSVRSLGKS